MQHAILTYRNTLKNIGTSDVYSNRVNDRIRLVNDLALIAIVFFIGCGLLRAVFDRPLPTLIPFIAALLMSAIWGLNYIKLHKIAQYAHYLILCGIITYLGIVHGPKDAAEYCLWVTCIIGLIYFDHIYILGGLWLVNFLCFWIVKYTHDHIPIPVESEHSFAPIYLTTIFFALFLIIYYFKKDNQTKADLLNEQNQDLTAQKDQSEKLLLNILPYAVAEELKSTGSNQPVFYEMATVLFVDFVDFTRLSQKLSPAKLVERLNEYFTAFDEIIEQYHIEKIKTIGDAYMCAGGLPEANVTNPADAVSAALEIQSYVRRRKIALEKEGDHAFDLRIGIHTGPVIACVVGKSKFAYDIWGETVNIAALMEQSSETGEINISGYTYGHIKDQFDVHPRGKVASDHLGMIDMYFVQHRSPAASSSV